MLAIQEHHRHGKDLLAFDFLLEDTAIDRHDLDARVNYRHRVQCLHDFRAVVARQRDVGFKNMVTIQGSNLVDDRLLQLDGVAAHVQQCQHEGGEFVAQRDAGKTHADICADAVDRERRGALIGFVAHGDLVAQLCDFTQQLVHFARFRRIIQGCNQLDRLHHFFQIGLQLFLEGRVKHDGFLKLFESINGGR